MTAPSPKKQPIPFGKYLLLDRVNIGGMAEVWRGKTFGAGGFERLVAIKRILPSIAEDEEFIHMFIDEAKITVQLTHANIAQIYELGNHASSYFISMEYISGKDMRAIFDRCRKRGEPAPVPLVCYVISKVCEGLDYAHRKKDGMGRDMNIVHRDVSPQNVLISYEGEIKVIDFGIAKAAGKMTKTQAGILKGKFGYMSPEQIRGLPIDRRSDVFAVGVCLYEMLTGERLFVGDSDFSVLEKVRKAEVLPPSTYNRRIPEALEKIVLKALAREVEERYQYANELADDLQRFLITSDTIFSRKDLMQYMKSTFAEDVEREKQRLQEYVEIKAPEGMRMAADMGFGLGQTLPPLAPAAPSSAVTAPPAVAPPVLLPAAVAGGVSAPPVLTPAGVSGVVRTPSVTGLPKLTAAAPLLTNRAEEEQQATMIVGGEAGDEPTTDSTAVFPKVAPIPLTEAARVVSTPSSPTLPLIAAGDRAPPNEPPSPRPGSVVAHPRQAPSALVPRRNGTLYAVIGSFAVLVVVASLAVVAALRPPPTGLLLIEVSSELRGKARVNINGEEIRDSDGKPTREWPVLRSVPAGKAVVLIAAEGYETFTETVEVKEGQGFSPLKVKLKRTNQTVQGP